MRTVVLDTNVLLADPDILMSYPDAEVIIPETVLGEIDKLKTSRVDPDLRFRGREVSRRLFELSEDSSLVGGVDLPDGGRLRVVPFDSDVELPDGLSARSPDDRILAAAYQVCKDGCEDLTIVTNDLNMLLKAQTFGLKVERRAEHEGGWAKRYIIRPFQRYKIPLAILAIAVAVFAGVIALSFYTSSLGNSRTAGVPAEFRDLLSKDYRDLLDGLTKLDTDANDIDSLRQVANACYNLNVSTRNVLFAQKAIEYYNRYLSSRPDDNDIRTDMAAMYFSTGLTDRAIQEATQVIQSDPNHVQATFNLGIFYWQGRSDYETAARQFIATYQLTRDGTDPHDQVVAEDALRNLTALAKDAETAGRPLTIDISSVLGGAS